MAEPLPGRWVSTFASDIQPGDTVRIRGTEHRVIGRTWPTVEHPVLHLDYDDGTGEPIGKITEVQIWDPGDGSVEARVVSISAMAIGGNSASHGRAAGFR